MSQPVQPEVYCPRCRIEVQPIKAAVHWYCPHCVWQFSDADIWRAKDKPAGQGSAEEGEQPPA